MTVDDALEHRRWAVRSRLPVAVSDRLARLGTDLSASERRLIEAAADAFFPSGDAMPLSGSEAGMVRYVAEYLALSRPAERLLLHLLLRFTDWSPIAFGPRPLPFTRLDAAARLEHLRAAFQSRIYFRRIAFTSLRALMTMGYLAHPAIARHIGIVHDPDPFGLGANAARTP